MARWASIRCPHCKERIQLYTIHQIKIFRVWRKRERALPEEPTAADLPPLLGSVGTALRARKTRSPRGGP